MLNRALVATDLSESSFAMVGCLGSLRFFGVKEILLLQCLSLQEVASIALSYTTSYLEEMLARQKKLLENEGFIVQTRISTGGAKSEINHVAEGEDFPLIVVGSRGYSLVGGAFLGGVASQVILNARKPVLIIRLNPSPNGVSVCSSAFKSDISGHVLYATDFSSNAEQAFSFLEEMAAGGFGSITLLHVQDKNHIEPYLMDRLDEFNETDAKRLEKLKAQIETKGAPNVSTEIRYGVPFVEIMKCIKEKGASLVVMGSQGRGFVRELFLGSVSQNIARHAETSVLLVPSRDRKE